MAVEPYVVVIVFVYDLTFVSVVCLSYDVVWRQRRFSSPFELLIDVVVSLSLRLQLILYHFIVYALGHTIPLPFAHKIFVIRSFSCTVLFNRTFLDEVTRIVYVLVSHRFVPFVKIEPFGKFGGHGFYVIQSAESHVFASTGLRKVLRSLHQFSPLTSGGAHNVDVPVFQTTVGVDV